MIWFYSVGSVLIISLISLVGLFTLSVREENLKRFVFVLVSLSVGALFGDAFIHLLPEVFESGIPAPRISLAVLSGIMLFFVLEKFLLWRHSHGHDEEGIESEKHDHSKKPLGPMVLVADGVHNFIDGIIIATSFLVSVEVGIATSIAVILHEIPQEIGDFGLLIHSGYSRFQALAFNFFSALTALLGTILTLAIGSSIESVLPIASALAAGGFIYIAGSDLVPELHKEKKFAPSAIQVVCVLLGVALMFALLLLE